MLRAMLVSMNFSFAGLRQLVPFPASSSPPFFWPCASIRREVDHLILADLLRAPAAHPANQLASPY
jgi:hypothetical protein